LKRACGGMVRGRGLTERVVERVVLIVVILANDILESKEKVSETW
jgi:hypothetical protein